MPRPGFKLELGVAPWLGSSDASPGEVFDFYGMPLCGVLKQGDQNFLFECLDGVCTRENLWGYAPIDLVIDMVELQDLTGGEFSAYVRDVMSGPHAVFARAESYKIVEFPLSRPFEPPSYHYRFDVDDIFAELGPEFDVY